MRVSRHSRNRNERNAFFALLGFALAAALMPLPYMSVVTASPAAAPAFDAVDRNRDESIDLREAKAVRGLREGFDAMDRNGDGRLDRVEFARW
jgi:hypothetical protein